MRTTAFLGLLLAASLASAQVYPPDSTGGGGLVESGDIDWPLLAPDGTATAPSYSFTDDTDMGLKRSGNFLNIQNAATAQLGHGALTLGPTFWDLITYQVGDATDYGNFECYNNSGDTECFLEVTDGTNTSFTSFLNDGTSFSDPILAPDGSVSAPGFGFSANPDVGFLLDSSQFIGVTLDNSQKYLFSGAGMYFSDNVGLLFGLNGDITFEGNTDDTNELVFDLDDPTADRFIYLQDESGWLSAMQKGTSTLTESSATNILSFPIGDTETMAGSLLLVTECDDTTNRVVTHETYDFVCINESDAEVCAFSGSLGAGLEVNDGSGNFSGHAVSYTGGTNTAIFTLNAVCSLSQTLLESSWEIQFHAGAYGPVTELN